MILLAFGTILASKITLKLHIQPPAEHDLQNLLLSHSVQHIFPSLGFIPNIFSFPSILSVFLHVEMSVNGTELCRAQLESPFLLQLH